MKQVNTIYKQLYWNTNQIVTYYKTMQDKHTAKKYHGLLLAAHAIQTLINLPSQMKSGDTCVLNYIMLQWPLMLLLLRPFGFLALKDLYNIWLSHVLALYVSDEGYSRGKLCWLMSIFTLIFLNFKQKH